MASVLPHKTYPLKYDVCNYPYIEERALTDPQRYLHKVFALRVINYFHLIQASRSYYTHLIRTIEAFRAITAQAELNLRNHVAFLQKPSARQLQPCKTFACTDAVERIQLLTHPALISRVGWGAYELLGISQQIYIADYIMTQELYDRIELLNALMINYHQQTTKFHLSKTGTLAHNALSAPVRSLIKGTQHELQKFTVNRQLQTKRSRFATSYRDIWAYRKATERYKPKKLPVDAPRHATLVAVQGTQLTSTGGSGGSGGSQYTPRISASSTHQKRSQPHSSNSGRPTPGSKTPPPSAKQKPS
jgi:hypothetical protein